jgi:hypothetical protein
MTKVLSARRMREMQFLAMVSLWILMRVRVTTIVGVTNRIELL